MVGGEFTGTNRSGDKLGLMPAAPVGIALSIPCVQLIAVAFAFTGSQQESSYVLQDPIPQTVTIIHHPNRAVTVQQARGSGITEVSRAAAAIDGPIGGGWSHLPRCAHQAASTAAGGDI